MTQASKYNWAEVDQDFIADAIALVKHKVVNRKMTIDEFHNIIARHLKKIFPVRVRKSRYKHVQSNWVWTGGTYFSEHDYNRGKSIEVDLNYHVTDRFITMPTRRFNRLCSTIADTILHEIIHMHQYRKRRFKLISGYSSNAESTKQRIEQEYLGDADEVDAYAFNIACNLYRKYDGSEKKIVDYLNEDQKGKRRVYDEWRMYLKAFNHDHNHRIVKKLKKRVIHYLPKAKNGKPFRSADWIWH